MPRRPLRSWPALAILLLAAPAFAGTVYQWKDAKGVTHYSDAPPPDRKGVQNRQLKDASGTSNAASAPAEEPHCALARRNVAVLKEGKPAGADADGDGRPDKPLTDAERAEQIDRNERVLKTWCGAAASS